MELPDKNYQACDDLKLIFSMPELREAVDASNFEVAYRLIKNFSSPTHRNFTELMLTIGDNPLEYMTYVPSNFLYSSDIGGEFCIPSNILEIKSYAFNSCKKLTNIDLSSCIKLSRIGDYAFSSCTTLTSIDLSRCTSLTHISSWAFAWCYSLTNVILPNNLTSIGDCMFWHCRSLTSITIPKNVTSIGSGLFHNCPNLKKVIIPARFKQEDSWRQTLRNDAEIIYY